MTPTELNAMATYIDLYDATDSEYEREQHRIGLQGYCRQLIAALRSQTLPFHLASEKPEPYAKIFAVQKTDKGHTVLELLSGDHDEPNLCYHDDFGEYDLALNAEAYFTESDILAAWQSTQGGAHE